MLSRYEKNMNKKYIKVLFFQIESVQVMVKDRIIVVFSNSLSV